MKTGIVRAVNGLEETNPLLRAPAALREEKIL
jgi:hypothetical protein